MCQKKETPQWATQTIYKHLGFRRYAFAQTSNAQLCKLDGLDQPAWVMELYSGKKAFFAILEAPSVSHPRYFYICAATLRRVPVIDLGQTYKESPTGFEGRVSSDKDLNVCIEWK